MRADTGYIKLTRFTLLSKALRAGRDEVDDALKWGRILVFRLV